MIFQKPLGDGKATVWFVLVTGAPEGSVSVVGDFNGWTPGATPFVRIGELRLASIDVPVGHRYAFRYLAEGGRWFNDHAADDYVANGSGDANGIVDARGAPAPVQQAAAWRERLVRESGSSGRVTGTFRVFVSSTFRDFEVEREILRLQAFPHLRRYCEQRGARFEAVDLRWGVNEDAANDQQTMAICEAELGRCQRVSPRPNLVALVGDRYGWRPAPARVPAADLETLLQVVTPAAHQLIAWREDRPPEANGWYRRDDNAVGGEYLLRRTGSAAFGPVESQLVAVFRHAIAVVGWASSDPRRWKFEDSATHLELRYGALGASPDGAAFCYLRRFDREAHPGEALADRFQSVLPGGAPDDDARERASALKKSIRERLGSSGRTSDYAIADPERLVAEELDAVTTAVLTALSERVERDLRGVIDCELLLRFLEEIEGEAAVEGRQHAEFGSIRAAHFVGREDLVGRIGEYIRGNDSAPLVVHGRSGAGKSALLAHVSLLLRDRALFDSSTVVVTRFLGATPGSSDLFALLGSLCAEIGHAYGDEGPRFTDLDSRKHDFLKRLEQARAERPLVLILDAVDQLGSGPDDLSWIPGTLPPYVRLILSVLETDEPSETCWGIARARWPQQLVSVGRLEMEPAGDLLDAWLAEAGRRLTPDQRRDVLTRFGLTGLPLVLKIAFEAARRWASWEQLTPSGNVDAASMLGELLANLERPHHHGPLLVGRALAYLATGRVGLTEDELLDALSADEDVLDDFRHRNPHSPSIDRLPFIAWARLRADLDAYIIERREETGTTTLGFYHREVREAVVRRYLASAEQTRSHAALARLFRRRADPRGDGTCTGGDRRGLSELPYHTAGASDRDGLRRTLTDFSFLAAKIAALGVDRLARDFELTRMLPAGDDLESLDLVKGAIDLSRYALTSDPGQLGPQLLARLPRGFAPELDALCLAALRWRGAPCLAPRRASLTPPGRSAVRILSGHSNDVAALTVTADGTCLLSGSADETVRVWHLARGELIRILRVGARVTALAVSGGEVLVGTTGGLQLWDIDAGVRVRDLRMPSSLLSVAVTRDRRALAGCVDGTLEMWSLASGEKLASMKGHQSGVFSIAVLPDDNYVLTGSGFIDSWGEDYTEVLSKDDTVRLWDLRTAEPVCSLRHEGAHVLSVAVTPDGTRAVAGCRNGSLDLWDLRSRERLWTQAAGGEIVAVAVTPDGARVVTGSGGSQYTTSPDHCVKVWDLRDGRELLALHGHTGQVRAVAVTRDGRHAISGGGSIFFGSYVDTSVRVWDLHVDANRSPVSEHTGKVTGVAVLSKARAAASVAADGILKLWDLETGEEKRAWRVERYGVAGVAGTADARRIVTAGATGKLWDGRTGTLEHSIQATINSFRSVMVSFAGEHAILSTDGHVAVSDIDTGEEVFVFSVERLSMAACRRMGLTPDGGCLVCPTRYGAVVLDLERKNIRCQRWLTTGAANVALALPDGWRMAAGTGRLGLEWGEDSAGYVYVWDFERANPLHVLRGHSNEVLCLAACPSGRILVSGSSDATAYAWDVETGAPRGTYRGHAGAIDVVAVTPDGRHVASGSRDGTIQIWRPAGGHRVAGFSGESAITDLEISSDGRTLVAGDTAGRVLILNLDGLPAGPLLVNLWRSPDGACAFRCPSCLTWRKSTASVDADVHCPGCGQAVRLTRHVISGNWQRIAARSGAA